MFTTRPAFSLILLVVAAFGGTIATPTPAAASDCGGDYLQCLHETGSVLNSDQLHEDECYGEYVDCLNRQLLFF